MAKTVLVTGGYGFLGRAVAKHFKAQGCYVAGVGTGRWDASEFRMYGYDEWLDANINMSSLATLKAKVDVVAHCAGNGSVGYSISNPLQDFKKTVSSTAEVLEYIRLTNPAALLVYPSSAGVYGAKPDSPIRETDSLAPISPYGYHKKIVEELCESYSRLYGLKIVIIRFFSIYGPGLTKQLLWDAASKLSNAQAEPLFWGTGGETRDWLSVQDAAGLMSKVMQCKERFTILNGAAGNRVTVAETLEIVKNELGAPAKIKFNNIMREGDPRFYHADILRAKSLGWAPTIDLRDGICQYVKWFKEIHNDPGRFLA